MQLATEEAGEAAQYDDVEVEEEDDGTFIYFDAEDGQVSVGRQATEQTAEDETEATEERRVVPAEQDQRRPVISESTASTCGNVSTSRQVLTKYRV